MKFLDVNDPVTSALPAEAVTFNGVCLDEKISGYRTLNVTGREMLKAEVSSHDNVGDGSEYYSRRYPARELKVKYQIIAPDSLSFRNAFNELNMILDAGPSQVIFADEPDKYFTGVLSDIDDPDPGANAVTGSFTIYCSDPFKYSTTEKSFTGVKQSDGSYELEIQNAGAVPVPVRYEMTLGSSTGTINVSNAEGYLCIGVPENVDGKYVNGSQQLMDVWCDNIEPDKYGNMLTGYGAVMNQGVCTQDWVQSGDFVLDIGTTGGALRPDNTVTWTGADNWHGPTVTYTVPKDAQNVAPTKFRIAVDYFMETGRVGETGILEVCALDANKKRIANWQFVKSDLHNNVMTFYGNAGAADHDFYIQQYIVPNHWSNWHQGQIVIMKNGGTFRIVTPGGQKTVQLNSKANEGLAYITVAMMQYAKYSEYMANMGIRRIQVWADQVEMWKRLPDRYAAKDKIVLDGETSRIYVNGNRALDEVLGSEWIKAKPGTDKFVVTGSSWMTGTMTLKAYIREAWI